MTALTHEALFYSDRDTFLRGTVPFIRDGIAHGEAVLVVVSAPKIDALRDTLGNDAAHVEFADMLAVGKNPAWIIPKWREFVDEYSAAGRGARGIGEPIWAGRSSTELSEAHLHEALLNIAFAEGPTWSLLCPYDTSTLPPDVVARAHLTHPLVSRAGERSKSTEFSDHSTCATLFVEPLEPAPLSAATMPFDRTAVRDARRVVAATAADAGLPMSRVDDLVLAVSEVTTNSVMYGGGGGTMRLWADGRTVTCEIEDAGVIEDPLVGRRAPRPGVLGGRGLWLANALCDLVQIRTGTSGTVVRLHVRR